MAAVEAVGAVGALSSVDAVTTVGPVVAVGAVGATGAVAAVGAVGDPPPSMTSPRAAHPGRTRKSNSTAGARLTFTFCLSPPSAWLHVDGKRFACAPVNSADTTIREPCKGCEYGPTVLLPNDPRPSPGEASSGRSGERLRTRSAGVRLTSGAVAVAMTGAGFGLVAQESFVRRIEATVGAAMARVLGVVPARAVGSAVIFPIHGRFVGYTVTEGCTVAFLVAPFFVVAAMLTAGRRTPPTRAVGALTAVTVVFFGVNQARLFVVAASMRAWGYRSGYERSHVLLGTVLSTVGAVGGLLLFVWLLIREGGAKDDPTDRWAEAG